MLRLLPVGSLWHKQMLMWHLIWLDATRPNYHQYSLCFQGVSGDSSVLHLTQIDILLSFIKNNISNRYAPTHSPPHTHTACLASYSAKLLLQDILTYALFLESDAGEWNGENRDICKQALLQLYLLLTLLLGKSGTNKTFMQEFNKIYRFGLPFLWTSHAQCKFGVEEIYNACLNNMGG